MSNELYPISDDVISNADSLEDFASLWTLSSDIDQRNQWFKGDVLDRLVIKYGEKSLLEFSRMVNEKYQTLVLYRRVSRAFIKEQRNYNLTWTHYMLASMTDNWDQYKQVFETDNRIKWIEEAHDNNWNVPRFKNELITSNKKNLNIPLVDIYMQSIQKFGNIILHWDINKLNKKDRLILIDELNKISNKFQENIYDNPIK